MSSVLELDMKDQCQEALGPVNAYFTGLEVQHPPTQEEMLKHWIKYGGTKDWREKHPLQIPNAPATQN